MQRREKIATLLVAAAFAIVCWIAPAKADGLPKSGLLPLGEVGSTKNWSGFYVGIGGGYGWLDAEHAQTNGGMPDDPFNADGDSFVGGAVLGYNLQTGPLVVGIEAEGGYMDISGAGRIPSSDPKHHQAIDVDTGFYGLVAGRLGIAVGRTLIYGKGGYAIFEGDAGQKTTKPGFKTHRSENLQGFIYGAGVEQALSERISVRFEWVRFNLDSVTGDQESITDPPIGFKYTNETDVEIDTFKVGINFKLN